MPETLVKTSTNVRGIENPINTPGQNFLGQMYPGGTLVVASNSAANPTIVTTVMPHGLTTGDKVFFASATNSTPALNAQYAVIVLSTTTFSVPVDCTGGAGNSGGFDYAITSIPISTIPTVNTGTAHNLRVGDTVTIVASGSTPSLDGAQIVTAVPSATSYQIGAVAAITVAGSTTAAHYSKTTFYSNVYDVGNVADYCAVVINSLIGTATFSTLVDIQASVDGGTWFNVGYATMAAPQTALFAQLTITSTTATTYKIVSPGEISYVPYKYLRLKFSTSTNILIWATLNALSS
jgi:hypothetical protein